MLLADEVSPYASLGFESARVTYEQFQRFQGLFAGDACAGRWRGRGRRRHKDAGEIARMAEACRIADAALSEVLLDGWRVAPRHRSATSSRSACANWVRRARATKPSWRPDRVNAARPHHRPTNTMIEEGHTVIIDVGALYDGYHSDMTRTFFVGEPTPDQLRLYEVVLAAQRGGVAAVEAGVSTAELDAVCREHDRRDRLRRVVHVTAPVMAWAC